MTERKTCVEMFMSARAIGVPIMSITSPDPEITIKRLKAAMEQVEPDSPIIQYDCVNGWKSRNTPGSKAIKTVLEKAQVEPDATKNPVRMLVLAENLPKGSVLFVLSSHHRTHPQETSTFWQALWNLRDNYKGNFRSVVLMSPDITLPIDIANDVFSIDEALPDEATLLSIVEEITSAVQEGETGSDFKYTKENKAQAAKALRGLADFPAEQAVAFALKKDHIDIDEIQQRKRELLNDIPGLKVYQGKEGFDDLGGCDEVKKVLKSILTGKESPEVIVFLDEGEKAMAGATHEIGDNTGISQDFMGTLLTYMEDNECDGMILVGPTGTAKSAMAKAMGNEAQVPTVFLDLGGMKSSLVGASESRLRYALKVIDSIAHGRAFFIMTSNNISKIPPEFKRRFSSGTYFFDLPTAEEQAPIWRIHTKAYGIDFKQVKDVAQKDLTGSEIRNICKAAYRRGITLKEASENLVPVAVAGRDQIRKLRKAASGHFLSASYPGPYKYTVEDEKKEKPARAMKAPQD